MKILKYRNLILAIIVPTLLVVIAIYLHNLFTSPIFVLQNNNINIPTILTSSQYKFKLVTEDGLLDSNKKLSRINTQSIDVPLQVLAVEGQLLKYFDSVQKTVSSIDLQSKEVKVQVKIDKIEENTIVWDSILKDNKLYLVLLRLNKDSNYNPGNYGFIDTSGNVDGGKLIPGNDTNNSDAILAIYDINGDHAAINKEIILKQMTFPSLIGIEGTKLKFLCLNQNYEVNMTNNVIINTSDTARLNQKTNFLIPLDNSSDLILQRDDQSNFSLNIYNKKYSYTSIESVDLNNGDHNSFSVRVKNQEIYFKVNDNHLSDYLINKRIFDIRYLYLS